MKKISIMGGCLLAALILYGLIRKAFIKPADDGASQFAQYIQQSEGILAFFEGIGYLASKPGIISLLAIAIVVLSLLFRHYLQPLMIGLAVYLGDVLNKFLKSVTARERPPEPLHLEEGFSFPSGHAMVGVIFYGLFAYMIIEKIKSPALKKGIWAAVVLLMALIGISRVITNSHYVTDVIGGYFIGFVFLLGTILIYEWAKNLLAAAKKKKGGISA
ncbi:phosphatase PAP2 family protein [Metabacillus indicus]|uniref:phosphatase PAP2 family protein n=1 Tax=Metabacillus indicus TaxID=246786 RepID=UPI0011111DD5|nr:phosphatase PAP2 family protein [Metabacillus indicus]